MSRHRVIWTIDVEADSALEAAREAWVIQRRFDSTATVFDVQCEGKETQTIDLDVLGV